MDLTYLITLLNDLSDQSNAPKILNKYPLGDCLAAMIEFSKTLDKLGNKKSYDTQQMKQVLLSAICIIDENNIKKARKQPVKKSKQNENATNTDTNTADNNSNQELNATEEKIEEYIHYDMLLFVKWANM